MFVYKQQIFSVTYITIFSNPIFLVKNYLTALFKPVIFSVEGQLSLAHEEDERMPPKKKKKKTDKKRKKKKQKKKSEKYSDSSGSDSETVYPSDLKREEENRYGQIFTRRFS